MASDKTAEAALPRLQQPLFGSAWRALLKPLLWPITRLFDQIPAGRLHLTLGAKCYHFDSERPGPDAEIHILRPIRMARRLATKGHLGLGESWMAGDWDSPDPTALLHLLAVNEHRWRERQRGGPMHRVLSPLRHRRRSNTRTGSRRNIAYHYDLGNDFYQLWLDPSMTYSSAVFDQDTRAASAAPSTNEAQTPAKVVGSPVEPSTPATEQDPASLRHLELGDQLGEAQQRKYERLLDMLGAQPGEHLLEIGCGWGAMAEAAARRGLKITGITLSEEQLAWANGRFANPALRAPQGQAREASTEDPAAPASAAASSRSSAVGSGAAFAGQVDLRLQDYRDVTETFDHIVSIEMFEAVGEDYWPTYMETLRDRLRPGGTAALQVITISDDIFDDYKASPDFIQHYIFPGGMLPTVGRFDEAANAAGLEVVQRSFHGQDYAQTLSAWHQRFLDQLDAVRALGYDERFIRMWRYYLSYCEAGFLDDRIDVMQVALRHRQAPAAH